LAVQFADRSTPGSSAITSWQWDFGDGAKGTSTQQNPAHTYTGAGAYTVSLAVKTANGENTRSKAQFITVIPGGEGEGEGEVEGEAETPLHLNSFNINGGAKTTAVRQVVLNHGCSGVPVEYVASASATFAAAVWVPWTAAPPFTLSPGSGDKTVYLKLRDAQHTESETLSDTIRVDEPSDPHTILFDNTNGSPVLGMPDVPTLVTLASETYLAKITTDHSLADREQDPGTIQLVHANGRIYGPWSAVWSADLGSKEDDGRWEVPPDMAVPAGTYTVVDSDPESWSQNVQSGGQGFCVVEGGPLHIETDSFGDYRAHMEAFGMQLDSVDALGPATFTLGITAVDSSATSNPAVASHSYHIMGLPDVRPCNVVITVPVFTPTNRQTYLLLYDYSVSGNPDGSASVGMSFPMYLDAAVENGMARATLPGTGLQKGAGILPALGGGPKIGFGDEQCNWLARVETGFVSATSAKGHVRTFLSVHKCPAQLATDTNAILEEAYALLVQQGLSHPAAKEPIKVFIDDFNSLFHMFLRDDPKETFGCALFGSLYLNADLLMSTDADVKQQMRATIMHELNHIFQAQYGGSTWIQEAFAVWSEWLMCGGSFEPAVTGARAKDNASRFPIHGLFNEQGTAVMSSRGYPSPQCHGYGASVFLRYLDENCWGQGDVGRFWDELKRGHAGIQNAFKEHLGAGDDLPNQWHTFVEQLYGGVLSYSPGVTDMQMNALQAVIPAAPFSGEVRETTLESYSAKIFRIKFTYPTTPVEPSNMVVRCASEVTDEDLFGPDSVRVRLYQIGSGQLTLKDDIEPKKAFYWPDVHKQGPMTLLLLMSNAQHPTGPAHLWSYVQVFPRDHVYDRQFSVDFGTHRPVVYPFHVHTSFTLIPEGSGSYWRPRCTVLDDSAYYFHGDQKFDFNGTATDICGQYVLDIPEAGRQNIYLVTGVGFRVDFQDAQGTIIEKHEMEENPGHIQVDMPADTRQIWTYYQIQYSMTVKDTTTGEVVFSQPSHWAPHGTEYISIANEK
jgi:PKD repeat protein